MRGCIALFLIFLVCIDCVLIYWKISTVWWLNLCQGLLVCHQINKKVITHLGCLYHYGSRIKIDCCQQTLWIL